MKRIVLAFYAALLTGAYAQQSGVPARLTAVNGRKAPVYLQRMDNAKVVIQLRNSTKELPVPASKIANLEFLARFDTDKTRVLFITADYQGLVDKMEGELEPAVDDYWPFMFVENNFQQVFSMLMESYYKLGQYEKAANGAAILARSQNPTIRNNGQTMQVLVALQEGNMEEAEKVLTSLKSEAGVLYLRACIQRANGDPLSAIKLVGDIIAQHGNNLEWMPKTELLDAYLYMDLALTNSAISTARQVKNIYARSNIAADAEKLEGELTAAKIKAEAEAKAREEEEEKAKAEVRARARARAGISDDETESEPSSETMFGQPK